MNYVFKKNITNYYILITVFLCYHQIPYILGQYEEYPSFYYIWNNIDVDAIVQKTPISATTAATTTTPQKTTSQQTQAFLFNTNDLSILAEGDNCIMQNTGVHGKCRTTSKCESVVEDFRHGVRPQICSFTAREAIVCCPEDLPQQITPIVQVINRDDTFTNDYVRPSIQKCEEYSKLGVYKDSFITLVVDPSIQSIEIPICEFVHNTGLIVGGEQAKPGEFPHMAAVGWPEGNTINFNCGGSLISDEFVLTAGHCSSLHGVLPAVVRLGAHNLYKYDQTNQPQDYRIGEIIKHPLYKRSSHYNDIALIRLSQKVVFNKYIRPACLWQTHEINTTKTLATGWGLVEFAGVSSEELLKVALDIIDNSYCDSLYERTRRLRDGIIGSQVCAGYAKGGKDTCQGDSGGPIQVIMPNNKCVFHIVGVTSFGKACAELNGFGVYTRISEFIEWIESVVWK